MPKDFYNKLQEKLKSNTNFIGFFVAVFWGEERAVDARRLGVSFSGVGSAVSFFGFRPRFFGDGVESSWIDSSSSSTVAFVERRRRLVGVVVSSSSTEDRFVEEESSISFVLVDWRREAAFFGDAGDKLVA